MQYILNFLKGFVLVKVTGLAVERFINVVAYNQINMWDIFKTRDGVVMKVSVKDFKNLKDARKKTGVKLQIVNKTGMPFFLFRHRKRKLLLGGVLFFLFVLYFMSSFIWLIDIEGPERIETAAILEALNREGLTVGAFKNQVNPNDIENILLEQFDDLSWINIHIRGTRAHVLLTEILPKPEIIDRSIPTNVIAAKSGVITRIATSAGTPLKNVGDLVQVGELLVSGQVIVKQDESGEIINFVHAYSEVWARVNYEVNFLLPYEFAEREFTGRIRRARDFIIFGKNISLINVDNYYANYDRITSMRQLKLGENYPLPIIMRTIEAREFTPIVKRYTPDQARESANRMITSRIIREFDFETDIIDKIVNFTDTANGLQVDALITVIERIDVQEEFEF